MVTLFRKIVNDILQENIQGDGQLRSVSRTAGQGQSALWRGGLLPLQATREKTHQLWRYQDLFQGKTLSCQDVQSLQVQEVFGSRYEARFGNRARGEEGKVPERS